MEALKNKWSNLPLRRFFILSVCFFVGIAAILSVLIIGGCVAFRHWLLPEPDAAYLTIQETMDDGSVVKSTSRLEYGADLSQIPFLYEETDEVVIPGSKREEMKYSIEKIETGVDALTPKRKLAYQACGVIMFVAPAIFAFAAILWCSIYFYRYKLKRPLAILTGAAKQIAGQNLDFEIAYDCQDEMGELCRSFEDMRAALRENNKAMWEMLEERRLVQASVAHDLRNPITILEGYAEYLETGLKNGGMEKEKIARIARNMGVAAKRLEQYTESVRLFNQSEETKPVQKRVIASELADDMAEDMSLMAKKKNIVLEVENHLPVREIQADCALLYRVLENILNNALRYAKEKITLAFTMEENRLLVTVTDDGGGFSSETLNQKGKGLFVVGKDGHMGIGLSISRLLCRKHGGDLELSNTGDGACVKILILI